MYVPPTNITMPVFNRADLTLQNLEAVVTHTKTPYTLTVVDNGSEEMLRRELIKLHEKGYIHHLLLLEENFGISCACNLGWQLEPNKFFVKLDNDIEILAPDWLTILYGLWGTMRYTTLFGPVWDATQRIGLIKSDLGTYWKLPLSLSGQAFFVSPKVCAEMGYFNEDYGLYGEEDADYCLRCHYAKIRKYTYLANGILANHGSDNETYREHGIDKLLLHAQNVGDSKTIGIFALNVFLYAHGVRSLKVPLRYSCVQVQDCHATVVEREEYRIFHERLCQCQDLYTEANDPADPETLQKMHSILAENESITHRL